MRHWTLFILSKLLSPQLSRSSRRVLLILLPLSLPAQANFFWSTPAIHEELLGKPVYVRIFKDESTLELYVKQDHRYQLVKRYPICSYSGGLGPKQRESDLKSPEGFYQTDLEHLNPHSRYHLSFNIGFPNAYDRSQGYTGNFLMVHGNCVSRGCYAIGDDNIEEVYRFIELALRAGQTAVNVHIYPFRMTDHNLQHYAQSEFYEFWQQLKPGYDYFEENALPPQAFVINNRYMVLPG